jgi:hypothetical protein
VGAVDLIISFDRMAQKIMNQYRIKVASRPDALYIPSLKEIRRDALKPLLEDMDQSAPELASRLRTALSAIDPAALSTNAPEAEIPANGATNAAAGPGK